jgi:hypothetical protein
LHFSTAGADGEVLSAWITIDFNEIAESRASSGFLAWWLP